MKSVRNLSLLLIVILVGCGSNPPAPAVPDSSSTTPGNQSAEPAKETGDAASPEKKLTLGVMPKLVGIDFFNATERGAREAAKELGVELVYDGPVTNDVQQQVQMIETWIAKGYNAIAVAPNDPDAIAPVLEDAKAKGAAVVAWDADAAHGARDYFVSQCTPESVAKALLDLVAQNAGEDAKYIILTGSLTAANQNIWMQEMEKYRQARYPQMTNLSETPKVSEEDQALATQVTTDILKAYPEVEAILAITTVALPGAAEALKNSDRRDQVFLTGVSTPNVMREYVEQGVVKGFVLWDAVDLGYLTVQVAAAAAKGTLDPSQESFTAGRLGALKVADRVVVLGEPIV
ncbi:MAG: substrate-binding domain-containing protein, partial [Candidatus Hydrogenedentes bacterium]|nr:substrate-binding domain-containing protein [Candidatus Hydrogenedentota bacterium]